MTLVQMTPIPIFLNFFSLITADFNIHANDTGPVVFLFLLCVYVTVSRLITVRHSLDI